ncbi:MAG: nitrate/sulfonate/bicarbonate ABC transporter ATP-binding protein [Thermoanaerobaculia bacterium]
MSALPTQPTPIARARGVSRVFRDEDGRERTVLANIDFEVRPDEVLAVLGPSGCGKSTLLRILIGLIPPSTGIVEQHGKPLEGIHPGAAVVFQNFALFPWLTVEENVRVGLYVRGLPESDARERVRGVISAVGLSGAARAYPKELSGGMKQRVGIARALVGRPELLCMDEPFSALDILTAELLRTEVYRLFKDPTTGLSSVLLITHLIEEAVYLGDRIVVLGANPGTVRREIVNPLPHPRSLKDSAFLRMVAEVHDAVTGVHLPEEAARVAPRVEAAIVPLPNVSIGEIGGLLDILLANGGEKNLFALDRDTEYDFGKTISVVKAAELLELVDTPRQRVLLTDLGRSLIAAKSAERLRILRRQILALGTFAAIVRFLAATPDAPRRGAEVRDMLAAHLPAADIPGLFEAVVNWGRYAELFEYEAATDELGLWAGSAGGSEEISGDA